MKTYKDIYKLPLRLAKYGTWVYDTNCHFVFQFEHYDRELNEKFLKVINGTASKDEMPTKTPFYYKRSRGYIRNVNDVNVILIRGWGNLTGSGAMNLPPEEAANIQDTFAEFILEQLNDSANR